MYIKYLISLVLPMIYIFLKNHIEVKKIDEHNYQFSNLKIHLYYYDLFFLIIIFLSIFPISHILLMDLWVMYYMVLSAFYIKKKNRKQSIKNKEKYFRRVWRLDIIYLLLMSYIIFLYEPENIIDYYLLIGSSIYIQNIVVLLIHKMVLKMEIYKNRSEKI